MAHGPRPTNLMQASCLTLCRESHAHSITKGLGDSRGCAAGCLLRNSTAPSPPLATVCPLLTSAAPYLPLAVADQVTSLFSSAPTQPRPVGFRFHKLLQCQSHDCWVLFILNMLALGWILLLEVRGFVQARDLLLPLHRLAQVNHQSLNQQHQVSNRCDR